MPDEKSPPLPAALSPPVSVCVDSLVAGAAAQSHTPAMAIGVARGGKVIHVVTGGAGLAPDMQSRIGSISKTFTATLVMGLRDEGALDLDTQIGAILPGVDLPGVTPRNLLAHISGLRREPSGAFTAEFARGNPAQVWWERAAGGDVATLLADVDTSAIIHRPWLTHHYSNLGYGLLGAVVEKVTGQPWLDALRKRLLEPLGLNRTTYDAVVPYARGYVVNPLDGTLREEPRHDTGAMAPAGQLWSTIEDLARWAGFLAAPDPDVLAPSTVDEMSRPASMDDPDSWTSGYGLGIQLWRSGDRSYVGHTGSMPGYLAVLMIHRRSGTAVVGFANAYTMIGGSLRSLAASVLDAVLDGEPTGPPTPAPLPQSTPANAAKLLGAWWWMGRLYDISWDGELVMTYRGEPTEAWRFTASGEGTWLCHSGMNAGETMIVTRNTGGVAVALDVATFYFTRDPWPNLDI